MSLLWVSLQLLAAAITGILTLIGVWRFRKPRLLSTGRLLFALLLSLFLLLLYVWIGGLPLNLLAGGLFFALGLLLGVLSGLTAQMARQGKLVIGRYSLLALLLWGGSLALSMLLNLAPSLLLAALGLLPVCLGSGLQVGNLGTLAVRRMRLGE